MKVLIAVGGIQCMLLCVALVKLFSLETQLSERSIASPEATGAAVQAEPGAAIAQPAKGLSRDEVRTVLRQELAAHFQQPQYSGENDSAESPGDTGYREPVTEEQEAQLAQYQDRIEYLVADGEISKSDMREFENSLASVSPQLRQELLNKLAKSMIRSNTNFTR